MKTIQAPEGYEACRQWRDGTRSWEAAYRRIGDTWWTIARRPVGHAYLTEEELDARAVAAVEHDVAMKRSA